MKKIALLLILVSGIILIDACKKVETDPKLDMSKAVNPMITEPTEGGNYILLEENDTVEINLTWLSASYFPEDLAIPFYLLQMVEADSTYDGAKVNDWGFVTSRVKVIINGESGNRDYITVSAKVEEDFLEAEEGVRISRFTFSSKDRDRVVDILVKNLDTGRTQIMITCWNLQ